MERNKTLGVRITEANTTSTTNYNTLDSKITQLTQSVNSNIANVSNDIKPVRDNLAATKTSVDLLTEKNTTIDNSIKKLVTELTNLKTDVAPYRTRFADIEKNYTDAMTSYNLNRTRIADIEKSYTDAMTSYNSIKVLPIVSQAEKIRLFETKLAALESFKVKTEGHVTRIDNTLQQFIPQFFKYFMSNINRIDTNIRNIAQSLQYTHYYLENVNYNSLKVDKEKARKFLGDSTKSPVNIKLSYGGDIYIENENTNYMARYKDSPDKSFDIYDKKYTLMYENDDIKFLKPINTTDDVLRTVKKMTTAKYMNVPTSSSTIETPVWGSGVLEVGTPSFTDAGKVFVPMPTGKIPSWWSTSDVF